MDWPFVAIGLLMMLGATAWLLATCFRKGHGSLKERLKRWRGIVSDAFSGLG